MNQFLFDEKVKKKQKSLPNNEKGLNGVKLKELVAN